MLCLYQFVYVLNLYPSEEKCFSWVERGINTSTVPGLGLCLDLGLILELVLSLILIMLKCKNI